MDKRSFWKPLQDFRLQPRAAALNSMKKVKKTSPFSWLAKHQRKFGMPVCILHLFQRIVLELKSYGNGPSPITDMRAPKKMAEKVKKELEVVTPSLNTPVSRLSGGNVQKVLVGREIAEAPTVLMTAYAVRGLDINTSYTIYNLLNEEKKEGVAVVYVGEDLDVLIDLCDRILVLCGGRENGILDARTTTKEEVGLLMTNLRKEGK